ncbi:MAG TPA: DUF5715 family protein [Longimicrobiaceae bacterium]|nr:DUF5715 family protein [Longimicrobiaceae bacterium]
MRRLVIPAVVALLGLAAAPAARDVPVTLRGSPESMARQHAVAREIGLRFVRTPAELRLLSRRGELVPVRGNADYELRTGMRDAVSRPELRGLVEHVAAGYRRACGERLVVTSLTRPSTRQPPNAHPLSVHPAGMAVDLRVSRRAACRNWLERTLLGLEEEGILDVTREQRPPHYHVAVFPAAYRLALERHAAEDAPVPAPAVPPLSAGPVR